MPSSPRRTTALVFALGLVLPACSKPREASKPATAMPSAAATAAPFAKAVPSGTTAPIATVRAKVSAVCSEPVEGSTVTSKDGGVRAFLERDPSRMEAAATDDVPHTRICVARGAEPARSVLESRSPAESDPPEAMLVGFERLELDGDGKTVYFTTPAWVTSTAAHAVEVATGKTRFLFDGVVERVLPDGLHAGKLLASHYRLDTKYPVESPKYRGRMETWTIATPEGKTVLTLPDDERLRDAALRRSAR